MTMQADWPFGELQHFRYELIMADPPWDFKTYSTSGNEKGAQNHYDCMPTEEICELPVGHLASKDCILWLWATNPMIDHALVTAKAWGFRYVTMGTWIKTTKNGKFGFGTGYRLRCASEPFLICTNGNPDTVKNVRSFFFGQIREHSRKPEEGYAIAEKYLRDPTAPRLDLFSRQRRLGWDNWGRESDKFDAPQSKKLPGSQ